jgi:hypothetical protein
MSQDKLYLHNYKIDRLRFKDNILENIRLHTSLNSKFQHKDHYISHIYSIFNKIYIRNKI